MIDLYPPIADESTELGIAFIEPGDRTVLYRQYCGRAMNDDWQAWRAAHPGREIVISGNLFLQRDSPAEPTTSSPPPAWTPQSARARRTIRLAVYDYLARHAHTDPPEAALTPPESRDIDTILDQARADLADPAAPHSTDVTVQQRGDERRHALAIPATWPQAGGRYHVEHDPGGDTTEGNSPCRSHRPAAA